MGNVEEKFLLGLIYIPKFVRTLGEEKKENGGVTKSYNM